MKPAPFEYHVPATATEAMALLEALGDGAKGIAGGQSLVPMLAMRLARFEHLVDIGRIGELRGVERQNGSLLVRATTRDAVIEHDAMVAEAVPLLALVTPMIGHFQIRNQGTVGGSLARRSGGRVPGGGHCLALRSKCSSHGERWVAAAVFFDGIWSTAMAPDELLTAIRFPVWEGRCGFGAASSLAGTVISPSPVRLRELGLARTAPSSDAPSLCSASARCRCGEAAAAITVQSIDAVSPEEIGRLAVGDVSDPGEDLHAPPGYRTRVGAAMAAKAWNQAVEEAGRA